MNTEIKNKRVSLEKIIWTVVMAVPVLAVLVLRLP